MVKDTSSSMIGRELSTTTDSNTRFNPSAVCDLTSVRKLERSLEGQLRSDDASEVSLGLR